MKYLFQAVAACLLLAVLNFNFSNASAQGTAFTYQGQLQNNGSLASGTYNLTFTLYSTGTAGSIVAGPVTNNAVGVTNGLFTVTINFGAAVWNGQTNWLQIGVESNGTTPFVALNPRQQLTPAPYAIAAGSLNGTLPASQLTSVGNTNVGSSDNFFVGQSGNSTTAGFNNTTVGTGALVNNSSGYDNTSEGSVTLAYNSSGSENTAVGYGSLYFNTRGSANTAVGYNSLNDVTTGSNNIALGSQAGLNLTTGNSNIDIGNQGFSSDTNIIRLGSGQSQTFIAGVINGNGGGLTNVNASLLYSIGNTNGGADNFFVGPSGNSTTSGNANTASGFGALANVTSGDENTANGAVALANNTTGIGNTAGGSEVLYSNTIGNYNTAYGRLVLFSNTNGSQNTAAGNSALTSNTSGNNNTAEGAGALENNTSGSNNTAFGFDAGQNLTTGSLNIDIGNQGVSSDTSIIRIGSSQSKAFIAGVITGNGAGLTNLPAIYASQLLSIGNPSPSSENFFVGFSGNATMTGQNNMANGFGAFTNNINGNFNTANGCLALANNTSGTANTANGLEALNNNTTGGYNTADGVLALYQNDVGSGNIALGFQAGEYVDGGSSNIDIGNVAQNGDNNIIRIGTTQTGTYLVGTVYANSVALTSDRNAKENFQPIDSRALLSRVAELPISQWNYKSDNQAVQHIGPMAQDFQAAFHLDGNDDRHISTVDEGGVALAAIQGLNQKLDEKNTVIQQQAAQIADLKARLEVLEQIVLKPKSQ
jgi:hypothetical protein